MTRGGQAYEMPSWFGDKKVISDSQTNGGDIG